MRGENVSKDNSTARIDKYVTGRAHDPLERIEAWIAVLTYLRTVKAGSNFGTAERKTHVSRVSGSDGVHGKTTGLVGGSGKGGHHVGFDSGAHLENVRL